MALDDIIRVTSTIETADARARAGLFGVTLFATLDTTLAPSGSGKVARYNNLVAVSGDFATTSEPYKAASAYFAQTPYPAPLVVSRFVTTAQGSQLVGGDHDSVATIAGLGSATFTISGEDSSPDFTGDTAFSDVATTLQAALRANTDLPGNSDIEVSYDATADRFDVTYDFDSDGDPYDITVASGAAATALGLDADSAATVRPGSAVESIATFLSKTSQRDDDWYWLTVDNTIGDSANADLTAAWAETSKRQFVLDVTGAGVLTGTSTDRAHVLSGLEYERTMLVYSATRDYKATSVEGLFAGVDLGTANSMLTAKFKSLSGRAADTLTDSEISTLTNARINYYTGFGGSNILSEGVSLKPGAYPDTRFFLDWFVDRAQSDVFTLLRTTRRVPQTDDGVALLIDAVEAVCREGVRSGAVAPGDIPESVANDIRVVTGNADFGRTLNLGWLVYVEPLSTLTSAEVAAREVPPVHVWMNVAGAVHSVDIDVSLSV